MDLLETITGAILARDHVLLAKTDDAGKRLFQPHVLYLATPRRRVFVEGFQLANSAKPADRPGWRSFDVEELRTVERLGRRFRVRHDYVPRAEKYRRGIVVDVERGR
jgi:hypothetical protein